MARTSRSWRSAGVRVSQLRIVQPLADHAMVDLGLLAQIERGQVKAESLHAPDQALHVGPAGVEAAIRLEAGGDEFEVAQELLRPFVTIGPAVVGEPQPLGHLPEEHAIRHAIVARGRDALRAGDQRARTARCVA